MNYEFERRDSLLKDFSEIDRINEVLRVYKAFNKEYYADVASRLTIAYMTNKGV
jgi:hypothetical protein